MAAHHATSTHTYDPLWDGGKARGAKGRSATLAIAIAVAAHAGLIYYIYETKFVVHYKQHGGDAVVTAELVPLARPTPPPPPKAAPVDRTPPPQALAPRTPLMLPDVAIGLPSLPIAPVEVQPPPPAPPPPVPEPVRPAAPRVIANPDWSSRPNGEDMARYYPERAQRLEQSGAVTVQCQVTAKGAVAGCAVLAETPMGLGFGDAAIKLSRLFKMKPKMEDGQAVEGAVVRIPIAFRLAN